MAKDKFVPSPMIRDKSTKTLVRKYEELSAQAARIEHQLALVRAQLQVQVGIGYQTAVKLEPGVYRQVTVNKLKHTGYRVDKLEAMFNQRDLDKCRGDTSYIRINVQDIGEDKYKEYLA